MLHPVRLLSTAIASMFALCLVSASGQAPQFSARSDAVVVDAQITDKRGQPVTDLTKAEVSVTIDGKPRSVSSIEFLRYESTSTETTPELAPGPARRAVSLPTRTSTDGQVFVVAIDCLGMSGGLSRQAAMAAKTFVAGLRPGDSVGLFTFPVGPKIEPTTDRTAIAQAFNTLSCSGEGITSARYVFRPSDIVDLASVESSGRTTAGTACEGFPRPECLEEARTLAQFWEAQAPVGFHMLSALFRNLAAIDARKTVVLVTAGILMSDRPGGRPDFGVNVIQLGAEAAKANAIFYTIFIDSTQRDRNSAANRQRLVNMTAAQRESDLLRKAVDQFTGAAGGTIITDLLGEGQTALKRIMTETAAYYLIGVESQSADRDGKRHEIRVKVNRPGTTVQNRRWVVVAE